MASFIFQRAPWRLQISRSQRTFSISFSTTLPQRSRPSPLLPETHNSTSSHSSRRRHHEQAPRRHHHHHHPHHQPSTTYQQARTAFTSTHSRHAQESSSQRPTTTEPPPPQTDLTLGLSDQPVVLDEGERQVDWTRSFHGLSSEPFPKEAGAILTEPVDQNDIEVKPDGILYLPEIKYRRILNRAFGPGGWGLAPRGETIVTAKAVTREYALVVLGRLVSVARGEQDYFSPEGIPTAAEGCKSNALMRCCKDLGIASELWDPRFIREFMKNRAKEIFVEHVVTKKKKKIFMRKDDQPRYPFKETKAFTAY